MKTWILIWFLVYPPAGPNQDVTWETVQHGGLTMQDCFEQMAEKDVQFKLLHEDGKVIGIQLYCKEDKTGITAAAAKDVEKNQNKERTDELD